MVKEMANPSRMVTIDDPNTTDYDCLLHQRVSILTVGSTYRDDMSLELPLLLEGILEKESDSHVVITGMRPVYKVANRHLFMSSYAILQKENIIGIYLQSPKE
jgi:hypothetical protein